MNYPASGGETTRNTGAVAGEIRITIEAIRKIATDNMTAMRENADSQASDFRATHLPGNAFGDTPIGQSVASLHTAAHDVFKKTIDGVILDLETFAANLEASCRAHEETDQRSADDQHRLGQDVLTGAAAQTAAPGQYQSDEHFQQSSEQHDEAIPDAPAYQHESDQPGQGEGPSEDGQGSDGGSGSAGYDGTQAPAPGTDGSSGFDGDTPASDASSTASPTTTPLFTPTSLDSDGDGLIDAMDFTPGGTAGDSTAR